MKGKDMLWSEYDLPIFMNVSNIQLNAEFAKLLEYMLSLFLPNRTPISSNALHSKIHSMRLKAEHGHVDLKRVPIIYKESDNNINKFQMIPIVNHTKPVVVTEIVKRLQTKYDKEFEIECKSFSPFEIYPEWLITFTTKEKRTEHTDFYLAEKFLNKYKNAAERKISCTLSLSHMRRLISRKTCQITGIKFSAKAGFPYSMTIDRLDNSKGYTDDNTVAIIKELNDHKSNISIEEIKMLYKYIKKKGL